MPTLQRIILVVRLKEWLKQGLWREDLRSVSRWRFFGIGTARVFVHAVRGFSRNLVGIQAAGLSMITLLALVPLLWLGLGVANGLGFGDRLEEKLEKIKTSNLPPNIQEVISEFQQMVSRIDFHTLGLFGSAILLYAGYALFTRTEAAFNHVWKANRRSWYGRLGGFVVIVVVVPILVLAAVITETMLERGIAYLPWLTSLYDFGIQFAPVTALWVAFTALYKTMPSVRVRWRAAAIAAVVPAFGLILINGLYVRAQHGLAIYNTVYAALAALPMLLVYLDLLWTLVLAGAHMSFAVQHVHDLGLPQAVVEASPLLHRRLALALTHAACRGEREGLSPLDLTEFTQRVDVPRVWVERASEDLVHAGVLLPVGDDQVKPARAAAEISIWDVVRAVEGDDPRERMSLDPEVESRLTESIDATREILGGMPVLRDS